MKKETVAKAIGYWLGVILVSILAVTIIALVAIYAYALLRAVGGRVL